MPAKRLAVVLLLLLPVALAGCSEPEPRTIGDFYELIPACPEDGEQFFEITGEFEEYEAAWKATELRGWDERWSNDRGWLGLEWTIHGFCDLEGSE